MRYGGPCAIRTAHSDEVGVKVSRTKLHRVRVQPLTKRTLCDSTCRKWNHASWVCSVCLPNTLLEKHFAKLKSISSPGGGQLGRMLANSAALLNIDLVVLDIGDRAPAKQVFQSKAGHIDGAFSDPLKIQELASKSDVLTVEIEHINVDALEAAGVNGKIQIHPSPSTLRTIQDKFLQKEHLDRHRIPVSEYCSVGSTEESLLAAGKRLGFPLMLKSRTMAYDGRGNLVVKDPSEARTAINVFGGRPLYAEKWVPFVKEVAVMVVRSARGEVRSYPVVETVHKDNICHLVFAPLRHPDPNVIRLAKEVAEKATQTFEGAGVFGVEMFLLADGARLALRDASSHRIYLRFSSGERNSPSPAQLWALYNRSLLNLTI